MQPSEQELREIYRHGEDACVAVLTQLFERVEALEAEVEDLKARLGSNSGNSSMPPSQDPFRHKSKNGRARARGRGTPAAGASSSPWPRSVP